MVYADVLFDEAAKAAARYPRLQPAAMDVTDAEQIAAVTERVAGELGRLDILVNNAGTNTAKHRVPLDQFPREEWDRLIEVDLTGVLLVSKAAAAVMVRQGAGRIINIASAFGLVAARLQCEYRSLPRLAW